MSSSPTSCHDVISRFLCTSRQAVSQYVLLHWQIPSWIEYQNNAFKCCDGKVSVEVVWNHAGASIGMGTYARATSGVIQALCNLGIMHASSSEMIQPRLIIFKTNITLPCTVLRDLPWEERVCLIGNPGSNKWHQFDATRPTSVANCPVVACALGIVANGALRT